MVSATGELPTVPTQLHESPAGLYSPRILLPLIVGGALVVTGVLLLHSDHDRIGSLVAALDGGLLLIVAGAVAFFLIGFWLVPASLITAGLTFLAAFELISHLPRLADANAAADFAIGFVGVAYGAAGAIRVALAPADQ